MYGLSLLGQLQGVLDEGYIVAGLAGTSAGAIVSTLHWAGLEPDAIRELFSQLSAQPGGLTTLLGTVPAGAGSFRVEELNRLKDLGKRLKSGASELTHGPFWSRISNWLVLPFRPLTHLSTILQGVRDLRTGKRATRQGGLFTGDEFEATIERMIRTSPKIAPHLEWLGVGPQQPITFGHILRLLENAKAFFPALILTGTNLSTGELVLFDSTDDRFQDVSIAKVVRASGGFPLFFEPVEISLPDLPDPDTGISPGTVTTHSFADGGVICNFPGFVYAGRDPRNPLKNHSIYQVLAAHPLVNIGLRLRETTPPHPGPLRDVASVAGSVWHLLSMGTRTYLETELAESTVERLVSIGQAFEETGWKENLLAVDKLNPNVIGEMFRLGREFARRNLQVLNFDRPLAVEVQPILDDLIPAACALFCQEDNDHLKFRVTVFMPGEFQLQMRYQSNMNDDALDTDRALTLEYWQGLVGFSYSKRRPVLCNLALLREASRTGDADPTRLFGLTPGLVSQIRLDRTFQVSVPVFDPETAVADSDEDDPEIGVEGVHFEEFESPLDAAVFGVVSLDAALDYEAFDLPQDASDLAHHPRVRALGDIMVLAAWELGKVFADYFAAVIEEDDDEGDENNGE